MNGVCGQTDHNFFFHLYKHMAVDLIISRIVNSGPLCCCKKELVNDVLGEVMQIEAKSVMGLVKICLSVTKLKLKVDNCTMY